MQLRNVMLPKRRFWKDEQMMQCGFSIEVSMVRSPNRVLTTLKSASKTNSETFARPSKIFAWEGKLSHRNVVYSKDTSACCQCCDSSFMLPKRRFWKEEQKMKSVFSTDFSIVSSPNRVLTPLKSASFEIRISSFVPPSKIFVWEG